MSSRPSAVNRVCRIGKGPVCVGVTAGVPVGFREVHGGAQLPEGRCDTTIPQQSTRCLGPLDADTWIAEVTRHDAALLITEDMVQQILGLVGQHGEGILKELLRARRGHLAVGYRACQGAGGFRFGGSIGQAAGQVVRPRQDATGIVLPVLRRILAADLDEHFDLILVGFLLAIDDAFGAREQVADGKRLA